MLALCPDNMIGKRDRALLALGFAGAFRRSELVRARGRGSGRDAGRAAGADPASRRAIRKGRGRRWRSRAATGCARSRRCRRGWRRQRSAPGRCSEQWRCGGRVSDDALADDSAARDREALCAAGRAGSGLLCRPQPALRASSHRRRRAAASVFKMIGGQPAQIAWTHSAATSAGLM